MTSIASSATISASPAFTPQRRSVHDSPSKVPLKGYFADGVWHCNCAPRLPAVHFETKNGGKNQGRWFYTCQKPQTSRCNFFIWDEDAHAREASTVLNNSRSEPRGTPLQRNARQISPSPSTSRIHRPSDRGSNVGQRLPPQSPAKRREHSMIDQDDDDDEPFEWDTSPTSSVYISNIVDDSATHLPPPPPYSRAVAAPETPRKAARTQLLGAGASPGKRRRESASSPPGDMVGGSGVVWPTPGPSLGTITPSTVATTDPFITPREMATPRRNLFSPTRDQPVSTAAVSPTRASHAGAETIAVPSPSLTKVSSPNHHNPEPPQSLSTAIFSILQSHNISLPATVASDIRKTCALSAARTLGVLRGRDLSRAALHKAEARVAELEGEIVWLEDGSETVREERDELTREVGRLRGRVEGLEAEREVLRALRGGEKQRERERQRGKDKGGEEWLVLRTRTRAPGEDSFGSTG